jgi:hypothetical protein
VGVAIEFDETVNSFALLQMPRNSGRRKYKVGRSSDTFVESVRFKQSRVGCPQDWQSSTHTGQASAGM